MIEEELEEESDEEEHLSEQVKIRHAQIQAEREQFARELAQERHRFEEYILFGESRVKKSKERN